MEKILEILERNARATNEQIAEMLGKSADDIAAAIKKYEDENVILGYNAVINWEKTNKDSVTALIEVKVTPQRGQGFDSVAARISRFREVKACYLMSGGFDLAVVVEGKTMKEVALFVAEKLSTIDSVLSSSTHFILKKFKENGVVFEEKTGDDREVVVL